MRHLSIFPLVFLLVGCGADDDGDDPGDGGQPSADASQPPADATTTGGEFDCSFDSCSAGSEYCLLTYKNGVELTVECVPLPAGCTTCGCAQEDAPNQFPTSNNCDFTISCSQSNDAIVVECSQ